MVRFTGKKVDVKGLSFEFREICVKSELCTHQLYDTVGHLTFMALSFLICKMKMMPISSVVVDIKLDSIFSHVAYKQHSVNGSVCTFLMTYLHKYRCMGDEKKRAEADRL